MRMFIWKKEAIVLNGFKNLYGMRYQGISAKSTFWSIHIYLRNAVVCMMKCHVIMNIKIAGTEKNMKMPDH